MSTSSQPLVCPCCTIAQPKQYCQRCLQSGLASHSSALSTLQSQLAISTKRCEHLLYHDASGRSRDGLGLERWRIARAGVAEKRKSVKLLREQVGIKERQVAAAKARIAELKTSLPVRRRNIERVDLSHEQHDIQARLTSIAARQADVSRRLIHARTVLINEAIDVFGIKKRKDGKTWEIAGLELPPFNEFKAFPSSQINAAIMHTLHLLSLITSYLSVSLPFEPTPPPPLNLPHVGRPLMKASTPFLGTTRWREKWVLWMSSTAASLDPKKKTRAKAEGPSIAQSIADLSIFQSHESSPTSQLSSNTLAKTLAKHRHFLTAFALLSHSIAYLAWTQGVDGIGLQESTRSPVRDEDDEDEGQGSTPDPSRSATPISKRSLIPPTDILHLLLLLSTSPSLGRRSHEPGSEPGLTLRHMGFGLDVSKVVQSVLDAEGGDRLEAEVGEGWDMLEHDQ